MYDFIYTLYDFLIYKLIFYNKYIYLLYTYKDYFIYCKAILYILC